MSRLPCGCEIVTERVVPPWGGEPTDKTTRIPCERCASVAAQQERDSPDTPTGPCSVCRGEGCGEEEGDFGERRTVECGHCNGSGSEPQCEHHWDPRDCVVCLRESSQPIIPGLEVDVY